jgi:hypothetical protein
MLPLHGELVLGVKIQLPFMKLHDIQVGDSLSSLGFKYVSNAVDIKTETFHLLDIVF